jgi:hypothetical protein
VRQLSEGSGWDAERAALEHQWRLCHFGVLCDLTTCLRHGDLMVFESTRTAMYEVKASKTAGAESPQTQRLSEATELINIGYGTIDGQRRAIVRCPTPFRSFLEILGPLLAEARRNGEAWLTHRRRTSSLPPT